MPSNTWITNVASIVEPVCVVEDLAVHSHTYKALSLETVSMFGKSCIFM